MRCLAFVTMIPFFPIDLEKHMQIKNPHGIFISILNTAWFFIFSFFQVTHFLLRRRRLIRAMRLTAISWCFLLLTLMKQHSVQYCLRTREQRQSTMTSRKIQQSKAKIIR